jgi:hypothetical protein
MSIITEPIFNAFEVLRKQLIFLPYLVSQPPFLAGSFSSKRLSIPNSFRLLELFREYQLFSEHYKTLTQPFSRGNTGMMLR